MAQLRSHVGFRLGVSFCVVITMGLASYFFVTRAIQEAIRQTDQTERSLNAAVGRAQDAAVAAHDTSASTVSYVRSGAQPDLEDKWEANADTLQALADISALLTRAPTGMSSVTRQSLLARQRAALDQEKDGCNPVEDAAIKLAQRGHAAAARDLLATRYVSARERLVLDIADLVTALGHAREQTERSRAQLMRRVITAGWIVQGVVLALSVLISVLITRATAAAVDKERHARAEMRASKERLQLREEQFRALAENATDLVTVLDADGTASYVSPSAAATLGRPQAESLGRSAFANVHPDDLGRVQAAFRKIVTDLGSTTTLEYRLQHADGSWRQLESVGRNLLHVPAIGGIVVNSRDVTERKAAQDLLLHQAFHDALTGLPNRALFLDRLESGLARARRRLDTLAVLFIDLDNFKVINDSLGHEAGDLLLVEVARRLRTAVREGDTVARLGGDEFTILLEEMGGVGEEDASMLAESIAARLLAPLTISGQEVFVTASMGIVVSGEGVDAGGLLREADIAMYRSKGNGKARFTLFDASMNADTEDRLTLEAELRYAIEGQELCLHFQPIVELATGRVTEVEALVRWNHPTRGLLPPSLFIPIAEETGLILPIGRWVLTEACRQAVAWQRQDRIGPPLTMSVNLSARQLQQTDMAAEVAKVLKETGLAAGQLKLEITESVMMQDPRKTTLHLEALRTLGVRLAIDDFGTGYSSMSYLSNFPLDTLKIDRSFISRMDQPEGLAIVQALVSLAQSLHLQVTSEGIETEAQLEILRGLCCSHGQGYHFGRPAAEPRLEDRAGPHLRRDPAGDTVTGMKDARMRAA